MSVEIFYWKRIQIKLVYPWSSPVNLNLSWGFLGIPGFGVIYTEKWEIFPKKWWELLS